MEYEQILDYWFGEMPHKAHFPENKYRIWFSGDKDINDYIRDNFEDTLKIAAQGKLDHWKETSRGWLALLIVLDQFPRNIYRYKAQSFSYDPLNLRLCLEGIEKGIDTQLFFIERAFFYLPLEHDERLEIQEKSVSQYKKLWEEAPTGIDKNMKIFYEKAVEHYEMIKRFGRYPYRNEIVGRSSTAEEIEYLKQPGSSFM